MKGRIKTTFASLKIRNYRLYFIGQAISLSGTWMQTIAQDWLVLQITHSGTQLGIVSAFQFLPILILGPWGGVIADRFSKRKILYVTQVVSAILALTLGLLVAFGLVQIWMVYLLALGLGMVNVINSPTVQTFVPEMVGPEHLQNAVSLNSTEVNLARAVGPAIAGALIVLVGIAWCFIFNAISYIAVLIAFYMMREKELHPIKRAPRKSGQLMEGLRYVRSNPVLFNTLIMMAIIGTFSYEFSIILPLVAQTTFGGNAASYALLVTATGVGSVIGGLYAAGRKKISPRMLVISAFGFGVSLTVAALMPTLALAVALMVVAGLFSINFISLGNITLQMESRPEMRGRVMALWTMAFLGSTPIGGPIIGWIGQHIGPRWGLGVGGVAAIIAAGIGVFTIVRRGKDAAVTRSEKVRDEQLEGRENPKME